MMMRSTVMPTADRRSGNDANKPSRRNFLAASALALPAIATGATRPEPLPPIEPLGEPVRMHLISHAYPFGEGYHLEAATVTEAEATRLAEKAERYEAAKDRDRDPERCVTPTVGVFHGDCFMIAWKGIPKGTALDHPLDVPSPDEDLGDTIPCCLHWLHEETSVLPGELFYASRAEILTAVAEINANRQGAEYDRTYDWGCPVEVGKPFQRPQLHEAEIWDDGGGFMTTEVIQPLRRVVPTAAERSRWAS